MAIGAVAEVAASAGDRAAQPGRIGAGSFLVVLVQLGLLALVLRQFQIEGGAFIRLALLAFGGFAVHALLPLKHRLPFFLILSLAGIVLILGTANGLWLVAIGLVLIGLCHLPVSYALRAALLLAAGALLAAMRKQWLPAVWSGAIWPILGSMFMFRLIVYFHELRHDKTPVSTMRTLSYFFMLPNVCFPLFPVVDYKTFRRNYFDDDAYRIYQVGIDWMLRGVIQLILYRFVYYYMTLAPSEVVNPEDLVRYLISNFLLYLRVSGQFHLVVGMLHLFGFRLPETNHLYLLASSFTDMWRRINIYWKDFMLNVFYYPAYFALRRLGTTKAMILSTLLVFFATWLLHAYQWFWLLGSTLLAWQDVLFWAILGSLVVINSLWEAKHGRDRKPRNASWSWRELAILTLKTLAMFCFTCVLWSFWTCESISAWLTLWSALGNPFRIHADIAPGLALAIMVVGSTGSNAGGSGGLGGPGPRTLLRALRPAIMTTVWLALLLCIGIEGVHTKLGPEVATVVHRLRTGQLNRLDNAQLERGYYERLLNVERVGSPLWDLYAKRPENWLDQAAGLKHFTGGFEQYDLMPSVTVTTQFGPISTNRWGMRDQDYAAQPGKDAFRIAVIGPSNVMGWGVGDGETFEDLLESRLNREHPQAPFASYEVLNFGVMGYVPLQQLVASEKALTFGPQVILYVATGREGTRSVNYLIEVVQKRIDIPYDYLKEVVRKSGVTPAMDETTAHKRLDPYRGEILAWLYRRIVDEARTRGVVPVLVFLPQTIGGAWRDENPEILRTAETSGFIVISLDDIFQGMDINSLQLADWDGHPNARAHQLIANRLYERILEKQDAIFNAAKR